MKCDYSLISRSILSLSLAGMLGACSPKQETPKDYEFSHVGRFPLVDSRGSGVSALAVADIDGDGDTDIIVGYGVHVAIYENKMPQKGKTNALERAVERR